MAEKGSPAGTQCCGALGFVVLRRSLVQRLAIVLTSAHFDALLLGYQVLDMAVITPPDVGDFATAARRRLVNCK